VVAQPRKTQRHSRTHDEELVQRQQHLPVRLRNARAVVHALVHRTEPGQRVTQEWLAKESGVARGTVRSVLNELRRIGEEREAQRLPPIVSLVRDRNEGRQAELAVLNPDAGYMAALELGHRRVTAAVGDLYGRVRSPHDWDTEVNDRFDTDPDLALRRGAALLERIVGEARAGRMAGVGIAVAAPVDPFSRLVQPIGATVPPDRGPQPGDWIHRDPAGELETRFADWRCQFTISNDANVAGWIEYLSARRAWRDEPALHNLLFVRWGSGVGGGLVIHDRRYPGFRGLAGEFAHARLPVVSKSDLPADPCARCGFVDCVENVVGYYRLAERLGFDREFEREQVERAPRAAQMIERLSNYLGAGLSGVVAALNPQAIAISGPTEAVAERVVEGVRSGLSAWTTPASFQAVRNRIYVTRLSSTDEDGSRLLAVATGALRRAYDVHATDYLMRELFGEDIAARIKQDRKR
jgi:predicted NBD/HSP70 family sugar kinase